jgi:beta-lactamase class C
VEQVVAGRVRELLPSNGAGGIGVAVRIDRRTLFFNYGYADLATQRPVTSETLFNLGSVAKTFDATLLAHAVQQGELSFDDPVAKHVVELQGGGDIRRVTLGQLASFTSGLFLPQDHPPWPEETFTQAGFLASLNRWKAEKGHQPGRQVIHAQSGFVLLHVALERRFAMPFGELMEQRLLKPLGLASTTLPVPPADPLTSPRGQLPIALLSRAVQGYANDGTLTGGPGDLQGYYHWLGAGQMYSSARDMAVFLAANLGELPDHRSIQEAMKVTQKGILRFGKRSMGAMAWERHQFAREIVERYGGLNNATATIAMIPARKLGIVILCNRGGPPVGTVARDILLRLATP